MLPNRAIARKYTLTKERLERLLPVVAQFEILELSGQNGLDVSGLNRGGKAADHARFKGIPMLIEQASHVFQGFSLLE